MTSSAFYPIGTPGTPWGPAEVAAWRTLQSRKRSHADEVLGRIDALRGRFEVAEYGRLDYAPEQYPLHVVKNRDWDEALHHARRYDRRGLTALFPEAEWTIEYVNYTNVLVFPAVWAIRKWRRLRPAATQARAEDRLPSPWLNRRLHRVFVKLGQTRFPWPFGVSLILVARKR